MSSVQNLRALINERLTAAAEEIFTEFEKTIVQYEEEIDRQRKLLENTWKPEIKLHTTGVPQQHVCKEEEVFTEQDVCNQEKNSSFVQKDPEPPQIKEEQEELCNILDGQQLVPNRKTDTFMLVQGPNEVKCEDLPQQKVSENTIGQCETATDHQHRLLNITQEPQIKLHRIDLQQQRVLKEQEVFADDPLREQDRNCSLDRKDPELPQIKEEQVESCIYLEPKNLEVPQIQEEQMELCSSQEGQQLVLSQEAVTFMVISTYGESAHSEPNPNTGQLVYHNAPLAKSQDHQGTNLTHLNSATTSNEMPKPEKTHEGGSAHSNNADNSSASEIHCHAATSEKSKACDVCGRVFKKKGCLQRHLKIHTGVKPYTCETCGRSFIHSHHLKVHMRTHTDKPCLLFFCNYCGKSFRDPQAFKWHTCYTG